MMPAAKSGQTAGISCIYQKEKIEMKTEKINSDYLVVFVGINFLPHAT